MVQNPLRSTPVASPENLDRKQEGQHQVPAPETTNLMRFYRILHLFYSPKITTITINAGKLNFVEPVKTSITSVKTWLCLSREDEGRIFIKFTEWLKAGLVRERAFKIVQI